MIHINKIENTETCFLQLWLLLDSTRHDLMQQFKRYCIRNILKSWFGTAATDDFIWEVCTRCEQEGLNELPVVTLYPLPHREFLRATVSTALHIGMRQVNLHALDTAYSIAFPYSTPINVCKRQRPP